MNPQPAATAPATAIDACPTRAQLADRIDKLLHVERPRYRRLWAYCRNPMRVLATDGDGADRPYRQAQEWGLPSRITGTRATAADVFSGDVIEEIARKEVVIENDIGWRIDTLVDYLFGRPLVIESAASDPQRRALIGELLRQILADNGGILLLQQLALLGSIYGFVDVLVKLDTSRCDSPGATPSQGCNTRELGRAPASCAPQISSLSDGVRPSADDAVDAAGQSNNGGEAGVTTRAEPASATSSASPATPTAGRGDQLDDENPPAIRAASGDDSHRAPSATTVGASLPPLLPWPA